MKRVSYASLLTLILILFSSIKSNAQTNVIGNPNKIVNIEVAQYNSVTIGSQQWMTEYLDVVTFNNGDTIQQAKNINELKNAFINKIPSWSFSNFDSTSRTKIYNFHAINDERQITPKGWKIPTENELEILKEYLNVSNSLSTTTRSKPYLSLISSNENGTNETGFNLKTATIMADFTDGSVDSEGKFEITPMVSFWVFFEILTDEKLLELEQFYEKNKDRIPQKPKLYKQIFKFVRFSKLGEDVHIFPLKIPLKYYEFISAPVRCIKTLYDIQLANGDVKKNGKWGMINAKTGQTVIPIKYDMFTSNLRYDEAFRTEVRYVKVNNKYGIVNKDGLELVTPTYDSISRLQWRNKTEIYLTKNGIEKIYNSPNDINENDFVKSRQEASKVLKNNKSIQNSNQNNFIRIGNIEVFSKDLEISNYYLARQRISNLGEGWRLPTEDELHLMYNNQDKIGGLTTTRAYSDDSQVISYLGGSTENTFCELYTENILAAKGNTYRRNWNSYSMAKFYFFLRPVRDIPVSENKNFTNNKKKTTNNNDDALSTILSLYQKQVLSDARSINKSSGNLDLGNAGLSKNASKSSSTSSNSGVCPQCQPYNSKGHRIQDFNVSTRLYSNERYIQKPGYIICKSCTGTGLMSQRGPNTCNQCNGERFRKCSYCNGTGKKN